MNRDEVLGAVARGWCSKECEKEVMNLALAESITNEVMKLKRRPVITDALIQDALKDLNASQVSIIKNGIDQHGAIGHYGRRFIAASIMEKVA